MLIFHLPSKTWGAFGRQSSPFKQFKCFNWRARKLWISMYQLLRQLLLASIQRAIKSHTRFDLIEVTFQLAGKSKHAYKIHLPNNSVSPQTTLWTSPLLKFPMKITVFFFQNKSEQNSFESNDWIQWTMFDWFHFEWN